MYFGWALVCASLTSVLQLTPTESFSPNFISLRRARSSRFVCSQSMPSASSVSLTSGSEEGSDVVLSGNVLAETGGEDLAPIKM